MRNSRGRKNLRKLFVGFLIIVMLYSSISLQSVSSLSSDFNQSDEINTSDTFPANSDYSINAYNPVINVSDVGSSFTARDRVTVDHEFSMNLTYNDIEDKFASDFTIDPISGYLTENLQYGITEIRAKRDNYTIEDLFDDETVIIDPSVIAIAQGFEIIWSNATFYGAYLNLDLFGLVSHTGNNELDLLLVKAEVSSGKPNMSNIISSGVNNT
ncbi:MAG: hypothetical protein ACTSQF_13335, partial [Candidatus Heimdallarchaeaceae archaeon]